MGFARVLVSGPLCWSELIEELADCKNLGRLVGAESEEVAITTYDDVRFALHCTLEETIVVRICLDDGEGNLCAHSFTELFEDEENGLIVGGGDAELVPEFALKLKEQDG